MILVILAAGLGSRYGGLKQLDSVSNSNESIIDFSLFDAIKSGATKVVFVVRKNFLNQIKELYLSKLGDKIKIEFVCQEVTTIPSEFSKNKRTKPWGTAHALWMAKDVVKDNFCVINADDFYGKDAFLKMSEFLKISKKTSYEFSMVGYQIEKTLSKNGTVSRGECLIDSEKYLREINERTSIHKKGNAIIYQEKEQEIELKSNTLVSMNFWGFTPQIFNEIEEQLYHFLKENYQEENKEFYLPTIVNNLLINKKASVKVLETNANWMGVTYKKDKENIVLKISKLKKTGIYPKKLWN